MCAIYGLFSYRMNPFPVFYRLRGTAINIISVIHNGHTHCMDWPVIHGRPLAQKATAIKSVGLAFTPIKEAQAWSVAMRHHQIAMPEKSQHGGGGPRRNHA